MPSAKICLLLLMHVQFTSQILSNVTFISSDVTLASNDVIGNAKITSSQPPSDISSVKVDDVTFGFSDVTVTTAYYLNVTDGKNTQVGGGVAGEKNYREIYDDYTVINSEVMLECFQNSSQEQALLIPKPIGEIFFKGPVSSDNSCHIKLAGPSGTVYRFVLYEIPRCDVTAFVIGDRDVDYDVENESGQDILDTMDCSMHSTMVYTFTNYVEVDIYVLDDRDEITINISYVAIMYSDRPKLEVNFTTPLMGYIQSPGWDGKTPHPSAMDACQDIIAPQDHVIMLSFLSVDVTGSEDTCDTEYVALYEGTGCSGRQVLRACHWPFPKAAVYDTTTMSLSVRFYSEVAEQYTGFRLLFSFHNKTEQPQKDLATDKWNCSVPFLDDFKHHFVCTLATECLNAEDKALCSSSQLCGDEMTAVGNSCYRFVRPEYALTWNDARSHCLRRGGQLVDMQLVEHWQGVRELLIGLEVNMRKQLYVGLRYAGATLPGLYQDMWQWNNKNVAYYLNLRGIARAPNYCASFKKSVDYLSIIACDEPEFSNFLCEVTLTAEERGLATETGTIELAELEIPATLRHESRELQLVRCPGNHSVHTFMACDVKSDCWGGENGEGRGGGDEEDGELFNCKLRKDENLQRAMVVSVVSVSADDNVPPSFLCKNGMERVPHTLVCDHRNDCCDGSDEDFCVFPACDLLIHFDCRNNQCIPRTQRCDGLSHCFNNADEVTCREKITSMMIATPPPPAIVRFDGKGNFTIHPLGDGYSCPETHYQCPGGGYCLPVFTRCNDVIDCPDGQDEEGCSTFECPGFYRCRGSRVCIHPDHLCDDIFQCPQRDDELLCDVTCPLNCTCFGLAFRCSSPFPANSFPELRYVDVNGSGMETRDLVNNSMLVSLSLSRCRLTTIGTLTFPNLHSLDLSYNLLTVLYHMEISALSNLRALALTGNPIVQFFPDLDLGKPFKVLQALDLSRIVNVELSASVLDLLPSLENFNLSHTVLTRVSEGGFQAVNRLRVLDLRGCPMRDFPPDLFSGLKDLSLMYAENFKLCCPASLPKGSEVLDNCFAPEDEISSCDDILRSNVFRVFLAFYAVLAIAGNAASFVYRVFVKRVGSHMGYDVFVTHLCIADFLMGVYLVIIGVADGYFKGRYLWEELTWKRSTACTLAGILCLMSSEVSAFIICLITVERFIVLRFPLTHAFRFRGWSAHIACLCAWLGGAALSVAPLFPATLHWEFYSQTAVCIPLPITRNSFAGHAYSTGVLIILNFVLFILIAWGQAMIYWSVRSNRSRAASNSKVSESTVARRLCSIALTDFLAWFPIGLLGLLASQGVPIPGEVNVVIAIFVLPVNAALNPFLYTLNVLWEKRMKAREERLMTILTTRLQNLNATCTGDRSFHHTVNNYSKDVGSSGNQVSITDVVSERL